MIVCATYTHKRAIDFREWVSQNVKAINIPPCSSFFFLHLDSKTLSITQFCSNTIRYFHKHYSHAPKTERRDEEDEVELLLDYSVQWALLSHMFCISCIKYYFYSFFNAPDNLLTFRAKHCLLLYLVKKSISHSTFRTHA